MNGTIVHPCPHCGQPFSLEPAYLAQYGGQLTACSRCQQQFTLPLASQVQPAYPQQAYGQPYGQPAYGASPQAPAYGAGQVLGYASPYAAAQPAGLPVWRERKLLVTLDKTRLPHVCVKCGQPGADRQFRRTYYWHAPWVYATILAGVLIYVIVAMCVRGKATVDISLCAAHRSARVRNIMISWLVFLSSIAAWVLAGYLDDRDLSPLLVIGGILLFFGGLIAILLSSRILTPKKIENGYVWLSGADERFLSGFPSTGR